MSAPDPFEGLFKWLALVVLCCITIGSCGAYLSEWGEGYDDCAECSE